MDDVPLEMAAPMTVVVNVSRITESQTNSTASVTAIVMVVTQEPVSVLANVLPADVPPEPVNEGLTLGDISMVARLASLVTVRATFPI